MSSIVNCPHCSRHLRVSEQITDKTLLCPHCFAEVDNPRQVTQIQATSINTDVKRDMKGGSIELVVLIGICVVGIALAASLGPLLFIVVPAVLVIIAIIRSLNRKHASSASRSIAERLLFIVFIVLGTIVAIAIFVFFACAIAISNMKFGR